MTLAATVPVFDEYTGDGSQVEYVVSSKPLSAQELTVTLDGVETTAYTMNAQLTRLTFNDAPGSGVAILIVRDTTISQDTDYVAYGQYKADQHEADFDKQARIAAEQDYALDNKLDVSHIEDGHPDLYYTKGETDSLLDAKADGSTKILTADNQTIALQNPALQSDVTIVPRTNVGNGLAKLDGVGKIPTSLLPATDGTFLGGYDASTNTNPPDALDGEYYLISKSGTLNVSAGVGSPPTPTPVSINDRIVFDEQTGWWFHFLAVTAGIGADAVTYDNATSGLVATDVQAALDEIVATKAEASLFEDGGGFGQVNNGASPRGIAQTLGWGVRGNQDNNARVIFEDQSGTVRGVMGYIAGDNLLFRNDIPGQPVRVRGRRGDDSEHVDLYGGEADGESYMNYNGVKTLRALDRALQVDGFKAIVQGVSGQTPRFEASNADWGASFDCAADGEARIRLREGDLTGAVTVLRANRGLGVEILDPDNPNTVIGNFDASGLDVTGSITTSGDVSWASDARLKENLQIIERPLEKIMRAKPYTFDRKDTGEHQAGLIAQEVMMAAPEAVRSDDDGMLSVNVGALLALLWGAVRELKERTDASA